MKRFFRNIPWRNVLIITLVAVLGIGAIAGISSIAKEEKKTISSTVFSRGAIDQNGFYVESDNSIYTKDLIECQGLEIEPDFEAGGHYQVFYYSANKSFVGSTLYMNTQSDGVYTKGETYPYAKYCRIVITPATPKDDYGNTIEDYKIKFYEVAGIANKFTITVNKEQSDNVFDFFKNIKEGEMYNWLEGNNSVVSNDGFYRTEYVHCSGVKELQLEVEDNFVGQRSIRVGYLDSKGSLIFTEGDSTSFNFVFTGTNSGETIIKTVKVPSNAVKVAFYTAEYGDVITDYFIVCN